MDEMKILGYAVTVIITLGGFIGVINKFTQPINELRVVMQKVNDTLEALKNDNATQTKRLDRHGEKIDILEKKVGKIETKMDMYHKGQS